MSVARWARRAALAAGALALLVAMGLAAGAALGWFSGQRANDLGVRNGAFAPGDWKPNWVSSTVAKDDPHYVPPIAFRDDPAVAWAKLQAAAWIVPGATVASKTPGYLHIEYRSRWLGFVDDAQFAIDPAASVIHVKSGARLGIRDFAANRKRVEAVRAAFGG